jgi:hypothetical protein
MHQGVDHVAIGLFECVQTIDERHVESFGWTNRREESVTGHDGELRAPRQEHRVENWFGVNAVAPSRLDVGEGLSLEDTDLEIRAQVQLVNEKVEATR